MIEVLFKRFLVTEMYTVWKSCNPSEWSSAMYPARK